MDIFTYLKKDHRKVSQLFKKIIASKKPKEREKLFLQAKLELELHAEPEHNTFYDALRKHSADLEEVDHADKEHERIKEALKKLSKIPSKEINKWLVQFGELKYIVEHHVEDEEGRMFSAAKKVIGEEEAQQLTQQMEQLKETMLRSAKFVKKIKI